MTYRNLGSETTIGDLPTLTKLGQPIELDEQLAAEAIEGGAILLTDAEFNSLGLTDEDQNRYATTGAQMQAPADISKKLAAGRLMAHHVRERAITKKSEQEVARMLAEAKTQKIRRESDEKNESERLAALKLADQSRREESIDNGFPESAFLDKVADLKGQHNA